MAKQAKRIYIPHTYTYDQFTTFSTRDVFTLVIRTNPIGQCCVDIANMDEEVLDEIDRRVGKFIPAARASLTATKTAKRLSPM